MNDQELPAMEQATPGLLDGVKVVEFSQNAAVPQCGRLLAGMGADVVKVEPTTGDAMRHLAPLAENEARAYATINPGKRAISLDMGADGAQEIIDRLLAWADIALIGLKVSDLGRFGLDWDRIHDREPSLVVLQFSAYGPEGPESQLGGYDQLVQAVSGLGFFMDRSKGGVPVGTRPAFVDFASGGYACAGVLAALRHRDQTGVGQRVDASLLGTALNLGNPQMASFDQDSDGNAELIFEMSMLREAGVDFDGQRAHWEGRVFAPGGLFELYVRIFRTTDGLIALSGYSPGLKDKLHDVTGLPRFTPDTRPGDEAFDAVVDQAEALFLSRSTADWIGDLRAVGYPCSRFNHALEAISEPQAEANDYVVDLEHQSFGGYRTVGMPFGFSEAPTSFTTTSPRLGEHTIEVLGELGFSPGEQQSFMSNGTTSGPPVQR